MKKYHAPASFFRPYRQDSRKISGCKHFYCARNTFAPHFCKKRNHCPGFAKTNSKKRGCLKSSYRTSKTAPRFSLFIKRNRCIQNGFLQFFGVLFFGRVVPGEIIGHIINNRFPVFFRLSNIEQNHPCSPV